MGFVNPRARCPQCGAKIHTAPKGLGHFALFGRSSWMLETGTECPYCGVPLTGRVKPGGVAERVGEAEEHEQRKAELRRKRSGISGPVELGTGEMEVVLEDVPHRGKVPVIKVIREFANPHMSLRGAKALADAAPIVVGRRLSRSDADRFAAELEDAGATAEVRVDLHVAK